uniref:Fe2OG dioxygenase domain-containing protein n=1 Tax=Minutocellus polymorphus TaxID=265543 RepID=A0A7S0FJM2_9STRA|mmetsp:Transcript_13255/g.22059  ORF Transcript_13255/g.22059 Transcript_13255/m.22059 type:complete len:371 (+) Transcript_13255:399-1511(+)|eukprot:CAMPEP_0197718392 /NCGR_PEP_ID=MMETSP1434-20131217/2564_1 /TAXON_ID=265543 /ORGANISM="Minutocellus polymorphus, Strain CCMP3303" /LENGTH=370 /DNA_ID=CAMNT_0043303037 /DNA_START=438 /DNA_END=1550 /DNA_ORIENTATION=-
MAFAIRYPIGLFFGLAVSVQSFHVNRALYVSSLHHYQERAGLHATIVTSSNGEAANTAREVEADLFQADLNRVGLSLCHGILHASGCRRLSDLRELTSAQIMTMGADAFDRPVIRRVMDDLEKIQTDRCNGGGADSNVSNDVSSTAANLSTLVDGAFVSTTKTRSRFEEETKREFDLEVICAENDIFKGRLFTPEECAQLNRMSEYHAYKGTGTVGAGWTNEIYTLTAQHMACESVPGFLSTTDGIFRQLVCELYSLYPERVRKGSIEFESSGEPHLVKYNGKARGTVLHTDNDDEYASTSITINALLSASDDFGGGGTYITAIDRTVQLKQGEMLIHLGNLEHAGAEITFGVRRLLVAFLACEWEDSSY